MNTRGGLLVFSILIWTSSLSAEHVKIQTDLDNVTLQTTIIQNLSYNCTGCQLYDDCICDINTDGGSCPCCVGFEFAEQLNCPPCVSLCENDDGPCLCGPNLDCINELCSYPDSTIDFVTVAKIALASALIITMIAVFSICWKSLIRPRCRNRCGTSHAEEDRTSLSSTQRYIIQLLDNRPPRYETEVSKPPSYEECIGASGSGDSAFDEPPSYAIAIGNSKPEDQPEPYVINNDIEIPLELVPIPLNVQCIRCQEQSSAERSFVPSPSENMDDFVDIDLSSSLHSVSYDRLHSDTQSMIESTFSDSLEACGGIDNAALEHDNDKSSKSIKDHGT